MIISDQPKCFDDKVLVALSSKDDGTMLNRQLGLHLEKVVENRRAFCASNGISYEDVVYQRIKYDDDYTYNQIEEVNQLSTTKYRPDLHADAIMTRTPGVGIFLPLADCIGLVAYGSRSRTLAVAHMGRHSTLTNLLSELIEGIKNDGNEPADIVIWMTPSVGRSSYRMEYFESKDDPEWQDYLKTDESGAIYIDLAGFNKSQLQMLGIPESNIDISSIDTFTSEDYFSHSAGERGGRFAVLAMLR